MVLRIFHTFVAIFGAIFVRNCAGEPLSQPAVSVTVSEVTTSSAVLSWDSHSREVTKCSLIYWEERAGQMSEVNLVEVDLERNGTFLLTPLDRNCSYRAQFKCFVGETKYGESEKILFATESGEDVVSTFMPHSNSKPPITEENAAEDNGSTPSLSRDILLGCFLGLLGIAILVSLQILIFRHWRRYIMYGRRFARMREEDRDEIPNFNIG
ncbi:Hypp7160 [Branchiostoma lanceolatum]|uniref:Hypp7160 protein n=1 Tax=Branchiostoma lanceolatum TaxID=7740 RepID=A0A8K0E856_BRALA|nr:Hypp7160 [Branchiostoma lanceolatum]